MTQTEDTGDDFPFEVALSFAGDNKRDKIRDITNQLKVFLGNDKVFFDEDYEHVFAGLNADNYFQDVYGKKTRLVVTCVCKRYVEKVWTQIEWRAIRNFAAKLQSDPVARVRFLPIQFDDGEVDLEGLFTYLDLILVMKDWSVNRIVNFIRKRHGECPGAKTIKPKGKRDDLTQSSDRKPQRRTKKSPNKPQNGKQVVGTRKSNSLELLLSLPSPIAMIFQNFVGKTAKPSKGQTIARPKPDPSEFRLCLNGLISFVTAISLADLWRSLSYVHRSKLIPLLRVLLGDQESPAQVVSSSTRLIEIAGLCKAAMELGLDNSSTAGSPRFFLSLTAQLVEELQKLGDALSHRRAALWETDADIIEILGENSQSIEVIQNFLTNAEIFVPTKVRSEHGGIRIHNGMRYDSTKGTWRSVAVDLNFPIDKSDPRSSSWSQTIVEGLSPLVLERGVWEQADGQKTTKVDVSQACSIFPFGFSEIQSDGNVAFNFFHDMKQAFQPSSLTNSVEAVEYLRLSTAKSGYMSYARQQQLACLTSINSFVAETNKSSGRYNLSIKPVAIDSAHEYVLCDQIEGRNDEIELIDEWIQDYRKPSVFCWEAFGGDGKSALINHWLFSRPETLKLLRDSGFEGAVWASFYQPNFDLVSFARLALEQMGRKRDPQLGDSDLVETFFHYASQCQILFVLDGVERLLRSEQLKEVEIVELLKKNGDKLPREYRLCRPFATDEERENTLPTSNDDFFERIGKLPIGTCRFLLTSRYSPAGVEELKRNSNAIIQILDPIDTSAAERIWWNAAGRTAISAEEAEAVRNAVAFIGCHPLTIRIVGSTVGERSFIDWNNDLRQKVSPTPFESGFKRDNASDYRTRCSEAIWHCGEFLEPQEREFLKALDKGFSGTVGIEHLENDPSILGVVGRFQFASRARQIIIKLKNLGWIGVSQGERLDLHPMIRQFAKDVRDNRGFSKNQSLTPAQFDKLIAEIRKKLELQPSSFAAAWRQISRRELWSACRKVGTVGARFKAAEKLTKLMRELLPKEDSDSYPLPVLPSRREQASCLYHLGGLESYLGNYESAILFLNFAKLLSRWIGFDELVESCQTTIQWASMYEGKLEAAANECDLHTYSLQWEICLALKGIKSAEFAATIPSMQAFASWNDRRLVFQACAEACFWRLELDDADKWTALLSQATKAPDSTANSLESAELGQIWWESWTFAVLSAERLIKGKEWDLVKIRKCLTLFEQAEKESLNAGYSIVASLSLAFELRLLSFAISKCHDPELNRRFINKKDAFTQNRLLQRPHAVCIFELANLRAELSESKQTTTTPTQAWEIVSSPNGKFYFGLKDLYSILEEYPDYDFTFRDQCGRLISEIERTPLQVRDFAPPVPAVTNSRNTKSEPETSVQPVQDWGILFSEFGEEIGYFKSLVQGFGGNGEDFGRFLRITGQSKGKVDPLLALLEMVIVTDIEGSPTQIEGLSVHSINKHIDDLRIRGLQDFNSSIRSSKHFGEQIEAIKGLKEYNENILNSLLHDGQRLLRLSELKDQPLILWRDRVPVYIRNENQDYLRLLLPFFESIIVAEVDLAKLIHRIRLPSQGCYRASFYRMYFELVLPEIFDRVSAGERETLRFWRSMYLCGWGTLSPEDKTRWRSFASSVPQATLMRVLEEMCQMDARIKELIDCVAQSGSNSPQGNLFLLKYNRRVAAEATLRDLKKQLASSMIKGESLRLNQEIASVNEQFPFWENNNG